MEDKTYYDGNFDDIIISIPSNTVEMRTEVIVYEDGELRKASCQYNLEDIRDAQNTFEMCCNGEYPTYQLTELGEKYVEDLRKCGAI